MRLPRQARSCKKGELGERGSGHGILFEGQPAVVRLRAAEPGPAGTYRVRRAEVARCLAVSFPCRLNVLRIDLPRGKWFAGRQRAEVSV
jgi:hypothetical protein